MMSWWCLGDVSVRSRLCFVCVSWMIWWYLGDVSVILWWCVKMFSACASDVLVIFKGCVGDVLGVSRWCVVIVLWCFGDMWMMPWFCVGDVSALSQWRVVMLRWCFGHGLWCFGDEHWWAFSDFQWVPTQKAWLFHVSLLLGSYAGLILFYIIPVEPHEAVPDVSKGKVHITQNKHVPIEWFVTTASQSRIWLKLLSDDSNKVGICLLCPSTQLHATTSCRSQFATTCDSSYVLQSSTPYWKSTTLYYKVLIQYYSSTTLYMVSATPVLLCTTKYYSSTTKYYSSTTLYYKVLIQYYSVLQSTTPVLL